MAQNRRIAAAVDADRLWRHHEAIAEIGATGRGGVNRQALTAEDAAARRQVIAWAAERGFRVAVDAIGNLFIRREGSDAGAAPVVAGSHLDSQPTGGNYDGVYGVLAAMEVLMAADDADIATVRPLDVVVWTNEEGSRFQPATMGSAVFVGALSLAEVLAVTDAQGATVANALDQTLRTVDVTVKRPLGFAMHAYLEAHIEQGPLLEATGKQLGIVVGIQGMRWYEVVVSGAEGHAGTTPSANRRDALAAAVDMAQALRLHMADVTDSVRFTIGRFNVTPNSPNTIPGRVLFTVDLRHPEAVELARLGDAIGDVCRAHAGPCDVVVRETIRSAPTSFAPPIQDLIRRVAGDLGIDHMDIVSGATHDAKFMADHCPSGMIFVPCAGGLSHNEAESADPADLAAGARVLAEVLIALAQS